MPQSNLQSHRPQSFHEFIHRIMQHPLTPKISGLIILLISLYLLKPMFNLIMMTLFLTVVTGQIALFIKKWFLIPTQVTIIALYVSLVSTIAFIGYHYFHLAALHINEMFSGVVGFYSTNPKTPIKIFNQTGLISSNTQYDLLHLFQHLHLNQQLANLPKWLAIHVPDIATFGLDMFLALILSFIITIELPTLIKFNQNFYHSQLATFFQTVFKLLSRFIQAFMLSIDTQLTIAFVNTIITTIGLALLGYQNLWLLAIMVWVLSLIPVVGALLSFIPLAILGFANGGIYDVIMVGILLIGVHAFESYILDPKLMANKTHLPVAYTFVTLIFGDIYLGVWGLLLAVPLLTFALDLLGVVELKKPKPNPKLEKFRLWLTKSIKKDHQ